MLIRDSDVTFKLPGSDSPLKKSISMTAIIHGGENKPNNRYYVDSLERFKRDYASIDKSQRQSKIKRQEEIRQRKRYQSIERNQNYKHIQENAYLKLKNRQTQSVYLHNNGIKMNMHTHSIPIDPINLKYLNSQNGKKQQSKDNEKRINTLIRTHHIQNCGNTGYNIINGQASLPIQQLVKPQYYPSFQEKLNNYYQRFRIKPNA